MDTLCAWRERCPGSGRDLAAATTSVPGRISRLFTWKRARNYAICVGLLYLAVFSYYTLLAGTAPLNRLGQPIGGDYIAFHTAGRMLIQGEAGALYEAARVRELQAQATLGLIPRLYDPFRNPPFFALPFAPLALLDLVPSFAAWTIVSIAALVAAVWLALGTVPGLKPRWRGIACITFGFAPIYLGLVNGQNSSLALLLYVLIYRAMLHGHERQAGLWAALGLFKPQLFVVFPIIFLAARRWRALAAYSLVGAGLALLSVLVVGVEGVLGWLRIVFSAELEGAIAATHAFRMHSLKAFFDLLLPSHAGVALGLSLSATALLLVPLVRVWRAPGAWTTDLPLRWAFTSAIAVLISPHVLDYDLSVLVLAGLLLGASIPSARAWLLGFYALLFLRLPLPLGDVHLQPTVVLLLLFTFWIWRRQAQEPLVSAASSQPSVGDSGSRNAHPSLTNGSSWSPTLTGNKEFRGGRPDS